MKKIIAAFLILASLFSLSSCSVIEKIFNKSFDYMTFPLDKYVYVPEQLYKGYDVTLFVDEPTERDVEYEIMRLIAKHKYANEGSSVETTDTTVGIGDVANVYYIGYTLNTDGTKNYLDRVSKVFGDPYKLEIGSGTFIPGFEYNLIGKNQNDYASLELIKSGSVGDDDIISITYSRYSADGKARLSFTGIMDLSAKNLDDVWGEGFADYIKNADIEIGKPFATGGYEDPKIVVPTVTDTYGEDIYFDVTVNGVYKIGDGVPLVVEAYFPKNYEEEALRGKNAYFDVYITSVYDYDTYDLCDSFITDQLKIDTKSLSDFDGDTLVEQFRNYIAASLRKSYNNKVNELIEEEFWQRALAGSTFYRLPEDKVEEKYNSLLEEFRAIYQIYSSDYSSFESFMAALTEYRNYEAELRAEAEEYVKKGLILYYIIRTENLPIYDDAAALNGDIYIPKDYSHHKMSVIDDFVNEITSSGGSIGTKLPLLNSIHNSQQNTGAPIISTDNSIKVDFEISASDGNLTSQYAYFGNCYVNAYTEIYAINHIISCANVTYA